MIFVLSKLFSETLSLKNISSSYILLLKDSNKQVEILMIVAGSFCLFGYSLVYARNGAIQPWYSSNLIIPFMMFVFGISGFVRSLLAEKTRLFLMLFFS